MENVEIDVKQEKKVNFKQNFTLLLLGRVVSNISTVAFNFALSLYVLDLTKSSAAFATIISFAILPGVFCNILAGVFVDRHDKKKIIVLSDILSGVFVYVFLLLFKMNSSSMILFISYVIVLNTLQAFFTLAINAAIPNIVSYDNVSKATSGLQGVGAAINVVGPILGAILYKTTGMEMIFLVNALSFILSGIAAMFLVFIKSISEEVDAKRLSYWQNVKEVFSYLDTQKALKFLLFIGVVLNSILNPLVFLVLQFISYNVLKVSGFQLSLIQSAWAVGTIVGSVFLMTRETYKPIIKRFFLLLEIQAVLIVLWFVPPLFIAVDVAKWITTILFILLIFAYGMLNTIQNIPIITHFQIIIPEKLRGKVFGVFFTAMNISTPIGMWVFGFLLKWTDWVYITTVSGAVVFALCVYLSFNKHFRVFTAELKD
jgi:DHA3 family macrolide efflux protein-like MFS transporter